MFGYTKQLVKYIKPAGVSSKSPVKPCLNVSQVGRIALSTLANRLPAQKHLQQRQTCNYGQSQSLLVLDLAKQTSEEL